jgi:hypothetical protein
MENNTKMQNTQVKTEKTVLWIYDTAQLYGVQKAVNEQSGESKAVTNYQQLGAVLSERTAEHGANNPSLIYAPVALDQRSEPQRRFTDALRAMGVHPDGIDYRHTFVSNPGGVHAERPDRPVSTLAPWIVHAIGLMSRHEAPVVVLVSGSFEPYYPLLDFVTKRNGKAFVAFFRRYLDVRWSQFTTLMEDDSPIGWIDLEPQAQQILGVDLLGKEQPPKPATGLSAIL